MFHDIYKWRPDYIKKHGYPKSNLFEILWPVFVVLAVYIAAVIYFLTITLRLKS